MQSRSPAVGLLVVLVAVSAGCATPRPTILGDQELASRFPELVAGQPFPVETIRDEASLRLAGVNEAFLDAFAADFDDVSVAIGHRPMPTPASLHLSAYAYRVRGATEKQLRKYFIPLLKEQSEDIPLVRATVNGRTVWRPRGTPVAVAGNMLYVHGDTAYLLYGNSRELVIQLLVALPA
jgi:hypothetical protein